MSREMYGMVSTVSVPCARVVGKLLSRPIDSRNTVMTFSAIFLQQAFAIVQSEYKNEIITSYIFHRLKARDFVDTYNGKCLRGSWVFLVTHSVTHRPTASDIDDRIRYVVTESIIDRHLKFNTWFHRCSRRVFGWVIRGNHLLFRVCISTKQVCKVKQLITCHESPAKRFFFYVVYMKRSWGPMQTACWREGSLQ